MGRPGRCGDKVAIRAGIINRNIGINPAAKFDFGGAGRIGGNLAALDDISSRQKLCAMTNSSNRFAGIVEIAHKPDDVFVQAKIFRRTATRDQKGVIVFSAR